MHKPYTQEQIRWLAHELWEQDHCPDDGAKFYWFKAERMLADEHPDPRITRLVEEAHQRYPDVGGVKP